MCVRSRKASITRMKVRGYTSKQTRATERYGSKGRKKKTRMYGWGNKKGRECANGWLNMVTETAHSSAQHSTAVPLVVGAGQVRCKVKLEGPDGWYTGAPTLHPRVLSETDGIETLPTPSPSLFQYLHIIQFYQLLRWGRRPFHPTLPAFPCCGTLPARSWWRWQFGNKEVRLVQIGIVVRGVWSLG